MAKKVFISYSHQQAEWVRQTLYPVLAAGGAEITIDYQEFSVGIAVRRQMSEAQSRADIHLLVLTPDYLKSDFCREEMQCAFAADPGFHAGLVLPIVLEACKLPPEMQAHEPLHVDLTGDRQRDPGAWRLVMERCEAELGTSVPGWLAAFRRATEALARKKSVNLLVKGRPRYASFLAQLRLANPEMGIVDLESGKTVTRRGLVAEILKAVANYAGEVPARDDLAELERVLEKGSAAILALVHFDVVRRRKDYADFYSSLRYMIMTKRHLTLVVQSRTPFAGLLPPNHVLSFLEMETVELGQA